MSSASDSSSLPYSTSAMLRSPATPEKKLYFCVDKFNEDDSSINYNWYTIDDNNSPVEPHLLAPVFESPSDSDSQHYSCGFAAWKSWIFIFGGCDSIALARALYSGDYGLDRFVSNVFYINTLHPKKGWKRGPSLNNARDSTHGVVFNGEIWALGGSSRDLSIFGESLQPFSGKGWSPMDMGLDDIVKDDNVDPYFAPAPITIAGHAIFSNKLFVYGSPIGALRSYDIGARKWTMVEEDFGAWRNTCASIGEMMYLVEGDTFKGYDLMSHEWYMGFGLEEFKHLPFTIEDTNRGPFSTLVHLGNGTLCLLWSSFVSQEYTCINCTKFGVSKEYNDRMSCYIIQATVKSFKVYRVHGGYLKGSIAVDAGEENDNEKVENEE